MALSLCLASPLCAALGDILGDAPALLPAVADGPEGPHDQAFLCVGNVVQNAG